MYVIMRECHLDLIFEKLIIFFTTTRCHCNFFAVIREHSYYGMDSVCNVEQHYTHGNVVDNHSWDAFNVCHKFVTMC